MENAANMRPSGLTVVFWDSFDAISAIGALARSGFSAQEVCAFGILGGSLPEFEAVLMELGLSEAESQSFQELFDEGGIVLLVRVQQEERRKVAARLMQRFGGFTTDSVLN